MKLMQSSNNYKLWKMISEQLLEDSREQLRARKNWRGLKSQKKCPLWLRLTITCVFPQGNYLVLSLDEVRADRKFPFYWPEQLRDWIWDGLREKIRVKGTLPNLHVPMWQGHGWEPHANITLSSRCRRASQLRLKKKWEIKSRKSDQK